MIFFLRKFTVILGNAPLSPLIDIFALAELECIPPAPAGKAKQERGSESISHVGGAIWTVRYADCGK